MPCGCKHKKRKKGSGSTFLSGVTWKGYGPYKQGKGWSFHGSGLAKRKRRKKTAGWLLPGGVAGTGGGLRKKRRRKKGSGATFSGSGINFSGSGYVFDGSGFKRRVGYRGKK